MTTRDPNSYEPPEAMLAMNAEQAGAFNEPTRTDIMMLLAERPATTKQLAEALGKPKGTIGHHLKALEDAGLIAVVWTRQVRAITEKYYGRVARTYVFPNLDAGGEKDHGFLGEMLQELRHPDEGEASMVTLRHARIPHDRAAEFAAEMLSVAEEFAASERGGDTVYGFIVGVYPTDRPSLKVVEEDKENEG
jgi:DNA-binding transcriptional ArsR family regulator